MSPLVQKDDMTAREGQGPRDILTQEVESYGPAHSVVS